MSFLIDTDICSAHLKSKGPVTNRFLQYGGRLHISTITVGELYTWCLRSGASPKREQGLKDFLNEVHVLDVGREVAERFGRLRAERLNAGLSLPDMDLLIASTALVHDLILVTHNVKDYEDIPDLIIEDWLAS